MKEQKRKEAPVCGCRGRRLLPQSWGADSRAGVGCGGGPQGRGQSPLGAGGQVRALVPGSAVYLPTGVCLWTGGPSQLPPLPCARL